MRKQYVAEAQKWQQKAEASYALYRESGSSFEYRHYQACSYFAWQAVQKIIALSENN